jgi:hypothetical protein
MGRPGEVRSGLDSESGWISSHSTSHIFKKEVKARTRLFSLTSIQSGGFPDLTAFA